jgi:hypothetical protein
MRVSALITVIIIQRAGGVFIMKTKLSAPPLIKRQYHTIFSNGVIYRKVTTRRCRKVADNAYLSKGGLRYRRRDCFSDLKQTSVKV